MLSRTGFRSSITKPNVGYRQPTTKEYGRGPSEEASGVLIVSAEFSDHPGAVRDTVYVKGGAPFELMVTSLVYRVWQPQTGSRTPDMA